MLQQCRESFWEIPLRLFGYKTLVLHNFSRARGRWRSVGPPSASEEIHKSISALIDRHYGVEANLLTEKKKPFRCGSMYGWIFATSQDETWSLHNRWIRKWQLGRRPHFRSLAVHAVLTHWWSSTVWARRLGSRSVARTPSHVRRCRPVYRGSCRWWRTGTSSETWASLLHQRQ